MVMGDNHVKPYKRLFVSLDEDVCFVLYTKYTANFRTIKTRA